MKAVLEDIPSKIVSASFYVSRISVPSFEFKWHYHPEYELTYIVNGTGYRMVGNSKEPFSSGEIVLLGSNLPHTWWGKLEDGGHSEAVVIQFSKEFIGTFTQLHECQSIVSLLEKAARGIRFEPHTILQDRIMALTKASGLDSLLNLLSILGDMANIPSSQICLETYQPVNSQKFETRINKVCAYIQHHFSESITLTQLANMLHMSESNFCKFFKKAMNTTCSDYLNDLRINEACHMLLSTEDSIGRIAHACGFDSISYFNRVFLKKKMLTPSKFRKL